MGFCVWDETPNYSTEVNLKLILFIEYVDYIQIYASCSYFYLSNLV